MPEAPIGSPLWWLGRLYTKLDARRPQLEVYNDYYVGDHPLAHVPPDIHKRYLVQFQELLRQSRANFCELVVDSTSERMRVNGFRLSAAEDETADLAAWQIWQANQMDAESPLGICDALTKGTSYLSVWFAGEGEEFPKIAVEDACQTITENVPGDRTKRAAALKVWIDDWTGKERANVYLPDGIYKFERTQPTASVTPKVSLVKPYAAMLEPVGPEWVELEDQRAGNPFNVVPIIPLVNRPDTRGCGRSEIKSVVPIQERINGTIFNRVLAGWFAAFRQKWATGIEIPVDPETGEPIEPFNAAIDRTFVSEEEHAKFGTFDATDLTPYLKAHERDIQDIAVITRTPRHYLFQEGQSPSGDAIKSAETGLVAKVRDKQRYMAEAFEEAIRLARRFGGESDAPVDSEIVWADPEYKSEAERTDSVIKQKAAGLITTAMAQEKLGYSPTEIERMREELIAEQLQEQAAIAMGELVTREQGPSSEPPVS